MSRMNIILSKTVDTLANKVNIEMLPKLNSMTEEEIRNQLLSYINDENIHMSSETRKKYRITINKVKGRINLMGYVYNIGLKTDGMGTF